MACVSVSPLRYRSSYQTTAFPGTRESDPRASRVIFPVLNTGAAIVAAEVAVSSPLANLEEDMVLRSEALLTPVGSVNPAMTGIAARPTFRRDRRPMICGRW